MKDEHFRILVVEDNKSILKMLNESLRENGAYVIPCEDGSNILQLMEKEKPDLVLLDVILPFKDGFSLLEEIRATSDIPVIMLTEKSDVEDKVKGFETGADDYLTKPFSNRELFVRIKNQLRRRKRGKHVITIGKLRIDSRARTFCFDGDDIDRLTKTEFDIVAKLAGNTPDVLTHGDLLEDVLGYKRDAETKALVIHVANIRRKFNMLGISDEIQIRSIAGVGYKLVVAGAIEK